MRRCIRNYKPQSCPKLPCEGGCRDSPLFRTECSDLLKKMVRGSAQRAMHTTKAHGPPNVEDPITITAITAGKDDKGLCGARVSVSMGNTVRALYILGRRGNGTLERLYGLREQ